MVDTADVVIIGGGCMGTSIAFRLAERGVKKVVLLEKNFLASGPTGKSIGNVVGYSPEEVELRIIQRSLQIFKRFAEEIGGDPGLVPTTRLRIAPEKDKKALEADAAWQKKMGVNLRFLPPTELKELLPQINTENVGAAVQYLDACYLNAVATTGAYARKARELGVTILEETEVTAIKLSGNKIRSVITNKGEIATPIVVNAAGVWAPNIGKMVGIDIPITVKRVETCTWLRPWDFRGIIPTVHTLYNEQMYRCEGNDLFLTFEVVAFRRPEKLIENPDKFNEEVDKETVEAFLGAMPRILPPMKRASYRGGYASVYDVTPDEHSILGKVPEVDGFYLCCGWSGHGFQQCPAIGELMAELITEGRTTLVDWSIFRLSRFKEGKLLSGAWGYRE